MNATFPHLVLAGVSVLAIAASVVYLIVVVRDEIQEWRKAATEWGQP